MDESPSCGRTIRGARACVASAVSLVCGDGETEEMVLRTAKPRIGRAQGGSGEPEEARQRAARGGRAALQRTSIRCVRACGYSINS